MVWRHSFRRLTNSPGFVVIATLSLALGIGVTSAAYSVLSAVLLRTLPVRDPARLAVVATRNAGSTYSMSYAAYTFLRDRSSAVRDVVSFRAMPVNVGTGAVTERVTGMMVSGNYFTGLGVTMTLGAPILPDDDRIPGTGGPRGVVGVLGHRYWVRRFGSDPAAVGRTVRVNGQAVTIVGVAPADFQGTRIGSLPDVFVPMMLAPLLYDAPNWLANPRNNWLRIMARLEPGVSSVQAEAEMTRTFRQFHQEVIVPVANTDAARQRAREAAIVLEPGYSGLLEFGTVVRPTLYSLMGLVALVLLLACVNVASLMLARAERRQRETAICIALGATGARLWAALFTETVVLGLAGVALGLVVATWTRGLFARLMPAAQEFDVAVDARVFAFAALLGLIVTAALTVITARQHTRMAIVGGLKGSDIVARLWLRKGLIVGQLALSVVVLAAAALFGRTLGALRVVDPGFEPRQVLIASFAPGGYTAERRTVFYTRLLDAVRAMPGVSAAALASDEPMNVGTGWNITLPGASGAAPRQATATVSFVSPGYFTTMGIDLVRGRDFVEQDARNPVHPIIVSQNFVRGYLAGVEPLGARVTGNGDMTFEVVGVVRDSAVIGLRDLDQQTIYVPGGGTVLHVRAAVAASALQTAIEATVRRLDPDVPVFNVRTIDQQIERVMVRERTFAGLSSTFGAVALLLSAVGLYGVIANAVSRRTRELGIRLALGARPRRILQSVLQEAGVLVAAGVAAGVPLALAMGRAVRAQLFGVQPWDSSSVAAAVALLIVVAAAAAWFPARRASRIDPLVALRAE